MKTIIFSIISVIATSVLYAQDSIAVLETKTKIIAFTPLKKDIKEVDGIAVGMGDAFDYHKGRVRKINGINLEPNPVGVLIWMLFDPSKSTNAMPHLVVNGLTISGAGYGRGTSHNGITISLYNYGYTMKGISIGGLSTDINKGSGILISGLGVSSAELNGISISAFNDSNQLKGVQIGIYNKGHEAKGMQVGLFNKSRKMKGLQIGFWNKNGKRSLPFINF
ncbi:LA_2272 family surface repeat-containing protein [Chryseobacterium proteolyticum]|uniref:LA_2272 family surface repeat-containing protein n=1 Tax=Chryseobacterium proteolyticum TaxID=118127 RepID=UPI00398325CB